MPRGTMQRDIKLRLDIKRNSTTVPLIGPNCGLIGVFMHVSVATLMGFQVIFKEFQTMPFFMKELLLFILMMLWLILWML
jgi:hypothetical protein